jgi:hypothetical protein
MELRTHKLYPNGKSLSMLLTEEITDMDNIVQMKVMESNPDISLMLHPLSSLKP